jgi:hypothetical protein
MQIRGGCCAAKAGLMGAGLILLFWVAQTGPEMVEGGKGGERGVKGQVVVVVGLGHLFCSSVRQSVGFPLDSRRATTMGRSNQ